MVMVYVPAGEFEMGSTEAQFQEVVRQCVKDSYARDICKEMFSDEKPAHTMHLDSFWIDKYEVTNDQFAAFLNAHGNQVEGDVTWIDISSDDCLIEQSNGRFRPRQGYADHPVVEVSWYGANAYADWVGGQLPSEAEWEYAARGPKGYIYPWGNDDPTCRLIQYSACSESTVPVDSLPDGASWCGVLGMAGNVSEWTRSLWGADRTKLDFDYPYNPRDGREDLEASGFRVLRGGGWRGSSSKYFFRCASRGRLAPSDRYPEYGFRVAISP
jgi:formylglycine-generating enzyme required for sulfatase activity